MAKIDFGCHVDGYIAVAAHTGINQLFIIVISFILRLLLYLIGGSYITSNFE